MAARQIVVDIIGDSKKYTKATDDAIKATGKIDGVLGKFNKRLQDITKSDGIAGAILGGVGVGAGLGVFNTISNVIGSAVDKIGASIDLASDKAEAASKANVLFGSSYKIIETASKSAATSVGLSSGAYLEAAGNLGNLIVNMGITGDSAAVMSRDMIALASDMGSFNNASTEEVTEAMGAAFRGETEPIRRFGVMLSAAKVEAQAMAMGLKEGKKPLTDQAKALATYQLILQQTTKAQGDFARTAEGKANADRIRAAQAEESWTRLGEVLTPLYQKVMPMLAQATTGVVEAITGIATAIAPLVDGALAAVSNAIDTVGDSFVALKQLLDPAGTEWDAVTRAIAEQAKVLGLDAEAVIAFTQAEEKRAAAQRERARITAAVAEIDQRMIDMTESATAEIKDYEEAVKAGGNADQFNNIIMERKLQLNGQIAPLEAEKNRLLGIQEQALADLNREEEASATVKGKATAALDAYNQMLATSAQLQTRLTHLIPPTTASVEDVADAFGGAAEAAKLLHVTIPGVVTASASMLPALAGMGGAAQTAAVRIRRLVPSIEDTLARMFRTVDDAKGRWQEQWRNLAQWAKDPFSPKSFADYIETRIDKAMDRAARAFGKKKQRWLEIGNAYRWIAKNNWIDPMNADVALVLSTLRLASRITESARPGTGGGGGVGNNAAGTPNWRGGRTWVGEDGPEIVDLPSGSAVYSNRQSMAMAGGGGTTVNVTINVPPTADLASVGRAVTQALKAYKNGGGGPAMRSAIGA